MNLGVVPLGYGWLGLGYGPYDAFSVPIVITSRLAADVLSNPVSIQSLYYADYLAVGVTDLTGKLEARQVRIERPRMSWMPAGGEKSLRGSSQSARQAGNNAVARTAERMIVRLLG